MTSALQVFNYEDSQIRTYTDNNGEVWLVAKDVCDVLGLSNPTEALRSLDDDEKMTLRDSEGHSGQRGGAQFLNVINEPGLYKLTFRSKKPNAKEFTRKVTHEILPQIRKTGYYVAPEIENAEEELEPLNIRVRIAGVLQRLALQVSDEAIRDHINRESYKYATGEPLPETQSKPKAKPAKEPKQHTPRSWTAEQIGKLLKWTADAVMHRAEDLEMTKKARYGWWDGGIWHFTKEGKQRFLDLVWKKVVRIKDGFEYYENGFKLIHWEFDADAWSA